jgi:hypothetical protein
MAASEPSQGSTRRTKLPSFKPSYCQFGLIIRGPERGEPGGLGGCHPTKKAHAKVPRDSILEGKDENPTWLVLLHSLFRLVPLAGCFVAINRSQGPGYGKQCHEPISFGLLFFIHVGWDC